jgi:hypothetical protein
MFAQPPMDEASPNHNAQHHLAIVTPHRLRREIAGDIENEMHRIRPE